MNPSEQLAVYDQEKSTYGVKIREVEIEKDQKQQINVLSTNTIYCIHFIFLIEYLASILQF